MRLLCVFLLSVLSAQGARMEIAGSTVQTVLGDQGARIETQTDARALQAGELFLDRFQLISQMKDWPYDIRGFDKVSYLGKGAFGETWLAFDREQKKNVAVKFFYRALRGGVMLLNMLNANAGEKALLRDAGKECDTPKAIVKAKNFPAGQARFALCFKNQVNDRSYAHLVLEVAGTQNLDEYVASKWKALGPTGTLALRSSTIKRIAKMMLEGLVQMEGFMVHKDIKPANIMVYEDADDGELYLRYIDFGLTAPENAASGVAGTPMFMPPEMWPLVPRNPQIDHKFDVYSAGEVLYWLICGKTFHEYIFDRFGNFREVEIAKELQRQNPASFCTPRTSLQALFQLVVKGMLPAAKVSRLDASTLLKDEMFRGIVTMKIEKPPVHKLEEKPKPPKPKEEEVMVPVVPAQPSRTFLDECHDDKSFWFKNVAQCCLREKYDPLREKFCRRPCGPNVPYMGGYCADDCNFKSDRAFKFSKRLQCCVSVVWETKCIYNAYNLKEGEGWAWMRG